MRARPVIQGRAGVWSSPLHRKHAARTRAARPKLHGSPLVEAGPDHAVDIALRHPPSRQQPSPFPPTAGERQATCVWKRSGSNPGPWDSTPCALPSARGARCCHGPGNSSDASRFLSVCLSVSRGLCSALRVWPAGATRMAGRPADPALLRSARPPVVCLILSVAGSQRPVTGPGRAARAIRRRPGTCMTS